MIKSDAFPGYQYKEVAASTIIFALNNGSGKWDNNGTQNYKITQSGTYTLKNGVITAGEPKLEVIKLFYRTNWEPANILYSADYQKWISLPGKIMDKREEYTDYKYTEITASALEFVISNNGQGHFDNNEKVVNNVPTALNYKINGGGIYTLENGVIRTGAPKIQISKITLSSEKKVIIADDVDVVTFSAIIKYENGKELVSKTVGYYEGKNKLANNSFKTKVDGVYSFYAELAGVTTNAITIKAIDVLTKIELTSNRTTVMTIKNDRVTLSAIGYDQNGDKIEADIKYYNSDTPLQSNVFSTTVKGIYSLKANAGNVWSNTVTVTAKDTADITKADWMAELNYFIQNKKLVDIVIPGTHDSATSGITPSSDFAQDGEGKELSSNFDKFNSVINTFDDIINSDAMSYFEFTGIADALSSIKNYLVRIRNSVKTHISSMALAQKRSIAEQLNDGIRYFDLRIVYQDNNFYAAHSLKSTEAVTILREVKEFVKVHNNEVVFLDFNHLYNMSEENKKTFVTKIKEELGDYIIYKTKDSKGIESKIADLNYGDVLKSSNKRVVVLFADANDDFFKSDDNTKNEWLYSNEPSDFRDANLHREIIKRAVSNGKDASKMWVIQGNLTPSLKMYVSGVIKRVLSNSDINTLISLLDTASSIIGGLKTVVDNIDPFGWLGLESFANELGGIQGYLSTGKDYLSAALSAKIYFSLEQVANDVNYVVDEEMKREDGNYKDINIVIVDQYQINNNSFVNVLLEKNIK